MRKLVFTFVFVFAFATANQTQAMTLQVDCFLEAIESLENFEAELGIGMINDEDAMVYLNEDYAACECLQNGNCYL